MKITILDGYTLNPGDLSWDSIKQYGELTVYDRTPSDKIIERAYGADIVVTNKTPISRETIDSLPSLKAVAVLATGYNVVDHVYAAEKNIPVMNIPSYSTNAVSQLVFSFMLEMCTNTAKHSESVRNGEWASNADFSYHVTPLYELCGKTIGIVGFGRIGRDVAKKADAFGMKVIVYAPRIPSEKPEYVEFTDIDTLCAKSDFITLHCPLTSETKGLVNKEFLGKMKETAYLINTSRGPVVDEQALADALNCGSIAGAGADVLSTEPPAKDNPLLTAKNCFITPHIAWAAYETRQRLMSIFEENIKAFVSGAPVNVVNM